MATGTTSATIRNIGVKNNEIQWSAIAADALGRAIGHGISAGSRIQMQQANQASKDNFEAAGIPYSTDWRGRPVEADGPPKPAHLMPGYGLDYDMADDGFFDEQGNEAILAQMARDDAAFARAYKNPNVPGMGSADRFFADSRFSGLKPYESDYRGTPIGFDPNVEAAKFNAGLDAMRAEVAATASGGNFDPGFGLGITRPMNEMGATASLAMAEQALSRAQNTHFSQVPLSENAQFASDTAKGMLGVLKSGVQSVVNDPLSIVRDPLVFAYDMIQGPAYWLTGGLTGDQDSYTRNLALGEAMVQYPGNVLDAFQTRNGENFGALTFAPIMMGVTRGRGAGVPNSGEIAAKGIKPMNSPNPEKWVTNGGTVWHELDGTWVYQDHAGNVVRYPNGFPDFQGGGYVRQSVDIETVPNHTADFINADKVAPLGQKLPENTWHHHQNETTMEEINKIIHSRFTHRGGVSIKNRGQ